MMSLPTIDPTDIFCEDCSLLKPQLAATGLFNHLQVPCIPYPISITEKHCPTCHQLLSYSPYNHQQSLVDPQLHISTPSISAGKQKSTGIFESNINYDSKERFATHQLYFNAVRAAKSGVSNLSVGRGFPARRGPKSTRGRGYTTHEHVEASNSRSQLLLPPTIVKPPIELLIKLLVMDIHNSSNGKKRFIESIDFESWRPTDDLLDKSIIAGSKEWSTFLQENVLRKTGLWKREFTDNIQEDGLGCIYIPPILTNR